MSQVVQLTNAPPKSVAWLLPALMGALVLALVCELSFGATFLSPLQWASLPGTNEGTILFAIRLPRALLAMVVGATLAASGAVVQGVLRNPLADPGLLGVSSGASLGAALSIVVLAPFVSGLELAFADVLRSLVSPVAAFCCALAVCFGIIRLATRSGSTSLFVLLLAGIAINAFVGAMIGLLSFFADDAKLRDLVFWTLGRLDVASFRDVAIATIPGGISMVMFFRVSRELDVLSVGERDARHLGLHVDRVVRRALAFVALAVGACVATSGLIGFVGLIVPHLIRLIAGPSHRLLIGASATLGATLLLVSDTLARSLKPPQGLPIGVITALLGAPVFLWLLLKVGSRGAPR